MSGVQTQVRLADGRILTLDAKPDYIRRYLMGPGDVVRAGKVVGQYEIVEVLDGTAHDTAHEPPESTQ